MRIRKGHWRAAPVVWAALLAGGCATTGRHIPQSFPQVGGDGAIVGWADAYQVTGTALSLRGAPYAWGGETPDGFDCSGFTQYVFARHGVRLPRTTADQYGVGLRVQRDQVQSGDLVFFTTVSSGASHVGVALGEGEFVHAPTENGVVRVEKLGAEYWSQRWVGARRVIGRRRRSGARARVAPDGQPPRSG